MVFDTSHISHFQVGQPTVQIPPNQVTKKTAGFLNKLGGIFQVIKQSPIGKFFTAFAKHPTVVKIAKVLKIAGKVFEPLDAAGAGWNGLGTAGEFIGRKLGGARGAALGKMIGQWGGALLLLGAASACVIFGGPAAVIAGVALAAGTAVSVSAVFIRDLNLHGIMHGIKHPLTGLKYMGNALLQGVSFDPLRSDFWAQKNNHSGQDSHAEQTAAKSIIPTVKPKPAAALIRTVTVTPPQGLKIKVGERSITGDHSAAAKTRKNPGARHRHSTYYGAIRPVTTPSKTSASTTVASTPVALSTGSLDLRSANLSGILDRISTGPISGLDLREAQSQDLTSFGLSDAGKIRISDFNLNTGGVTDLSSRGATPSFVRSLSGGDSYSLASLSPPISLSGFSPFKAIDNPAALGSAASNLRLSGVGLTQAAPALPPTSMVKAQTGLGL